MANQYQVTTATGAEQFKDKLLTFLTQRGWSVVQDPNPDDDHIYRVSNGGPTVRIWHWPLEEDGIPRYVYMEGDPLSLMYDGGELTTADFENPALSVSEMHMMGYDTPNCVYIVYRLSNGTWRQLFLGDVSKYGVWSGGFAYHQSRHAYEGHTDADLWPGGDVQNIRLFGGQQRAGGLFVDNGEGGTLKKWRPFSKGGTFGSGESLTYEILAPLDDPSWYDGSKYYYDQTYSALQNTYSPWNWSTHLLTVPFHVARPNDLISPLGFAPHLRITDGPTLSPGAEIVIGSETWRCFPMLRDAVPADNKAGSYNYYHCFYVAPGQETPQAV